MNAFRKNLRAIVRNSKKILKSSFFRAKFLYTKYYETTEVNSKIILIQSYSGNNISGNPYYILKELVSNPKYDDYKIYVGVTAKSYSESLDFLKREGLTKATIITLHTREYCRVLATAKYLINNVTFPFYFIKKPEQVYLNTWHGTPLKALGKSMTEDMHTIGNVQRNFLMSNYILLPNKFTLDILRKDYMLDHWFQNKYLLCGYPRNHVFYDQDYQKKLRDKLDLKNKKIFAYLPTWRGTHELRSDNEQYIYIMHMLIELDKVVDDDTIIYVKEHNMSSIDIDFSQFYHVEKFPNEYETYEFLSIADCLITDYSSVMFDYANTGRKIILYAYDKEEYLKDRGMYLDFDDLLFTKVYTTRELINEVLNLSSYENYKLQMDSLIRYDKTNSIEDVLDLMMGSNETPLEIIDSVKFRNNKENVLIFTGSLLRNGITTALKGVLSNLDKRERNYVLTFNKKAVSKNKKVIRELGDFDYISIQGQKNFRVAEVIAYFLYFRMNINNRWIEKKIKKLFMREAKRVYPGLHFDYLIHYTGYERQIMNLFCYMEGKKFVYVHNNLMKENKVRKNIHIPTLRKCYKLFDKIVIIRESMKEEIMSDIPGIEQKIHLAHNFNNYDEIKEKAKYPILFDEETECNKTVDELNQLLNEKDAIKFINIARFSVEKGLDNLVKAFDSYYGRNNNSYLIIIGGHGATYEETVELVNNSKAKENIIIIKSMSNPYPVLNRSDVFILSSHYEGLPMVIMEALILDKPVISTSITGPKEFLEKGYGYLVPDSIEGLVSGMLEYEKTKLKQLKKFDYVAFNCQALKEFNNLFE